MTVVQIGQKKKLTIKNAYILEIEKKNKLWSSKMIYLQYFEFCIPFPNEYK